MGSGVRTFAAFSPAIVGLASGLLAFARMPGLALALFAAYLLLAGVLCAVAPEKVRAFFFLGAHLDAWRPALKLFVSEEVAIPSIRFSGALALVMGAMLLWFAHFGPR